MWAIFLAHSDNKNYVLYKYRTDFLFQFGRHGRNYSPSPEPCGLCGIALKSRNLNHNPLNKAYVLL